MFLSVFVDANEVGLQPIGCLTEEMQNMFTFGNNTTQ